MCVPVRVIDAAPTETKALTSVSFLSPIRHGSPMCRSGRCSGVIAWTQNKTLTIAVQLDAVMRCRVDSYEITQPQRDKTGIASAGRMPVFSLGATYSSISICLATKFILKKKKQGERGYRLKSNETILKKKAQVTSNKQRNVRASKPSPKTVSRGGNTTKYGL